MSPFAGSRSLPARCPVSSTALASTMSPVPAESIGKGATEMDQDTTEPLDDDEPGRRRQIDPANIGPDGQYIVGKGRPPAKSKFAVGDGRSRGRRPKGQKNFDTEFAEEANRKVTLREN